MSIRGRKPKPTQLKVIQGNPGKRRLNANEPGVRAALLHAPDWFGAEQVDLWRYAIHHAPNGVLGTIDRETLAVWCVACCLHRRAVELQAKIDNGSSLPMMMRTQQGNVIQSPYLAVINRQAQIMLKAAAELGFTPSSRSRLSAPKTTDEEDEFEGLL